MMSFDRISLGRQAKDHPMALWKCNKNKIQE